jgi:hypothetical protein
MTFPKNELCLFGIRQSPDSTSSTALSIFHPDFRYIAYYYSIKIQSKLWVKINLAQTGSGVNEKKRFIIGEIYYENGNSGPNDIDFIKLSSLWCVK